MYDQGAEYRAVIGIPGGHKSPLMHIIGEANVHNMVLKHSGMGRWERDLTTWGSRHQLGTPPDADTFGTNSVYVVDSNKLPFFQAELCLQYHDDAVVKYPLEYHALKAKALAAGRIVDTGCRGECGSAP